MAQDEKVAITGGTKLVQRLTALEHSSSPFQDQFQEACDILNLQEGLPAQLNLSDLTREPEALHWNPKVEWIFRWLVKKLSPEELQPDSASLRVEAWHLARRLLVCVPNNIAAKHLRANKFVESLPGTLSWAASNLIANPAGKPSKLRKKNSDHAALPEQDSPHPLLLPAICVFLNTIHTKVESSTEPGVAAFSAENLKSSIRTKSNLAAEILCHAFQIVPAVVDAQGDFLTILEVCISPLCWVWSWAFDVVGESTEAANVAFSSQCAIPTTTLLSEYTLSDTDKQKQELERLVALHCIVPARELFLKQKSREALEVHEIKSLLSKFLEPLLILDVPDTESSTKFGPTKWLSSHTLPTFYDIAARTLPRKTIAERTVEDRWLNVLFDCITHQWVENTMTPGILEVTRELLQVSKRYKIKIKQQLLLRLCNSAVGNSRNVTEADWRLFGLCIDLDPDLVALPTVLSDVPTKQLLDKLSEIYQDQLECPRSRNFETDRSLISNEVCRAYEDSCRHVLLPLVAIHARRRALPRFVTFWQESLRNSLSSVAMASGKESRVSFAWEDERLVRAFSQHLEETMTDKQIANLFIELSKPMTSKEPNQKDTLIETRISSLIGSAVLGGLSRVSCVNLMEPEAQNVLDSLPSILSQQASSDIRRHLWFLVSLLLKHWPGLFLDGDNRGTVDTILEFAAEEGLSGLQTSDLVPSAYEEAIHAFNFLEAYAYAKTTMVTQPDAASLDEFRRRVISSATNGLELICNSEPSSYRASEWYGHTDELQDPHSLLLACCFMIVLKPSSMVLLPSSDLERFLSRLQHVALLSLWNEQNQPENPIQDQVSIIKKERITYHTLWFDLLGHTDIGNINTLATALRYALGGLLQSELGEDSLKKIETGERQDLLRHSLVPFDLRFEFIMDSVSKLSESLPSGFWITLENFLVKLLENEGQLSQNNSLRALEMLVLIVDNPSKEMRMIKHIRSVPWAIMENLGSILTNRETGTLFSALLMQVFSQSMKYSLQYGGVDLQEKLVDINRTYIAGSRRGHALITASALLHAARSQNPSEIEQREAIRNDFFTLLLLRVRDVSGPAADNATVMEWLSQALDLILDEREDFQYFVSQGTWARHLGINEKDYGILDFKVAIQKQEDILHRQVSQEPYINESESRNSSADTLSKLRLIKTMLPGGHENRISLLADALCADSNCTGREALMIGARVSMTLMAEYDNQEVSSFLEKILEFKEWTSNVPHLFAIKNIVGTTFATEQRTEALKSALGKVLHEVIFSLTAQSSADTFVLNVHVLNAGLLKNGWVITQPHIDNAITEVSAMTKGMESSLRPGNEEKIFNALCTVMGSVLAAHRIRTGGRHHLLVSALQGLLRCLFVPYSSSQKSHHPGLRTLKHPPWLDARKSPLTAERAGEWSRLVESICDPPASAVKKRSKDHQEQQQQLNDATKKAKAVAGQHMMFVMMEFCALQLQGKLHPEARAALNPGLYAMFDAMGHGGRAALNSMLDAQGRAVYKELFEEWKKFGKWDGK